MTKKFEPSQERYNSYLLDGQEFEEPHAVSLADMDRGKYEATGPNAPRNGNRHPGAIGKDLDDFATAGDAPEKGF
jgi:hypothetical protein